MRQLVIIFFCLSLAACGAVPWNPQNNAGLTNVHMEGCGQDEGIDGQMFCDIRVIDGKEKADVNVAVTKNADGTFKASYEAKDVTAFAGQEIRGQVETAVANAIKEVAPDITKAIIEGVVKSIVPTATTVPSLPDIPGQ